LTKERDQPLSYIGKWHFSIDGNRRITITFITNGIGFYGMYIGNNLVEGSGPFTYTATNASITVSSPNSPNITMPYRLTADQNGLYLDNFFGSSQTFMGTR
jgi:hypothetical protein